MIGYRNSIFINKKSPIKGQRHKLSYIFVRLNTPLEWIPTFSSENRNNIN